MAQVSTRPAFRPPDEASRHRAAVADRLIDTSEVDRAPHTVEREISRILAAQPGLNINGLVVRRVRDGVCLTGVVESTDADPDVCGLLRDVDGVSQIINRLLVRSARRV